MRGANMLRVLAVISRNLSMPLLLLLKFSCMRSSNLLTAFNNSISILNLLLATFWQDLMYENYCIKTWWPTCHDEKSTVQPIRSKAAITNLIKAQKILRKITEMYVSETKYPYSEEKHFFNSCYFSNFYSSFFLLLNLNRDFRWFIPISLFFLIETVNCKIGFRWRNFKWPKDLLSCCMIALVLALSTVAKPVIGNS